MLQKHAIKFKLVVNDGL